jgi:hypothetical protein
MVGLVQIIAGLLKMGRLMRFVTNAVMAGFLTGVSVLVVLSQLGDFSGYSSEYSNKIAFVTNWASFYGDVDLQDRSPDNETSTHTPRLHLPTMETEGLLTSVWHNGVIFCPHADELGMFMITRRFDSDVLTQQKVQEGSNVPMGARIV